MAHGCTVLSHRPRGRGMHDSMHAAGLSARGKWCRVRRRRRKRTTATAITRSPVKPPLMCTSMVAITRARYSTAIASRVRYRSQYRTPASPKRFKQFFL
ncbi:hypothetical protein GW17_00051423 [Ensete ventricosum]|nr:hypothetical protein GW17_00051423 [Ensete ventricosum]